MINPKIKPGNYTRKVFQQFTSPTPASAPHGAAWEMSHDDLNALLSGLDQSAKFILPEEGNVGIKMAPDEIVGRLGNIFKLPFPQTALEYTFSMKHRGDNRKHKALVVCLEGIRSNDEIDLDSDDPNGFLISFFVCDTDNPKWILLPRANWISTEENSLIASQPVDSMKGYGYELLDNNSQGYFDALYDRCTETVFNFIAVSQLKNVRGVHLPADVKLKTKGSKNGSVPFYDYIVLDINIGILENPCEGSSGSSQGSKESSRAHAVMGHVKTRKTGNYWWSAHLRGDVAKGIIKKAYRYIKKRFEK